MVFYAYGTWVNIGNTTTRFAGGIIQPFLPIEQVPAPIEIEPNEAPTILTTSSLPDTVRGLDHADDFYLVELEAIGSGRLRWSVVEGTLPDGLRLDERTGEISGRPTVNSNGVSSFLIQVENEEGVDTKLFSIAVFTVPRFFQDSLFVRRPQYGRVGVAHIEKYFAEHLMSATSLPATWSIAAGTLPSGLNINENTGEIFGTPTTSGVFYFTVQVSNSVGNAMREHSITITDDQSPPRIFRIDRLQMRDGRIGHNFQQTVFADGCAPMIWSIVEGDLPAGLVLDENTGVIYGVPTTAGRSPFTIHAENDAGYDTRRLSILIHED